MTRLAQIPIRVVRQAPGAACAPAAPAVGGAVAGAVAGAVVGAAGGLGGGVYAIVAELVRLLDDLVRHQQAGVIDLRSLPMSAQDRVALKQLLGEGEVQANFDAEGISHFCETSVPGVWWVEHRDRGGELIAELIEVAGVPALLSSAPDEIASGARMLEARLAGLGPTRSDMPYHQPGDGPTAALAPLPIRPPPLVPAGDTRDATRQ